MKGRSHHQVFCKLQLLSANKSPTFKIFFILFSANSFAKPNEFIEESNKGHQMLMKMGWAGTGTGLGTKNQGIDQPISAGEVRDRKDMYKVRLIVKYCLCIKHYCCCFSQGVGVNTNDPFEHFRKNKGAAFVHRMRARDEKS